MKIVYQQRNSLKSTAILFIVNKENFNNMMYYRQLLDKIYSGVDYTCLINGTFEVDKLFNLVVKDDHTNSYESLKYFIKNTTHTKILLILDDLVILDKNKYKISYPDELPKKGYWFPLFNKAISNTTNSQRVSILKNYNVFSNNFCFITIGKKDSKLREKLLQKLDTFTQIQDLILLKKKIESFDKIVSKDVSLLIPEQYKILKKKKIEVENNLLNIVDQQTLPFDKYGVKLSRTKLYNIINERIDKYVDSYKFVECPCRRNFVECPCKQKIKDCPCKREFQNCPCRKRSISQNSIESYCSCEDVKIPRPILFPNKSNLSKRKNSKIAKK